jgi:CRISPR-associated endonuclease Cas1/group II intron reverse transcriptase/maturase
VVAHYRQGELPEPLLEFDKRRDGRLENLAFRLRNQTFLPQPAFLIYIPKPNHPDEKRPISLLEPEDRIVLTALNILLNPILDRSLLPGCFAYRPNRGAGVAIDFVHRLICQGHTHIATGDLDNFFSSIDRNRLMALLRKRVWETPLINLLEIYLHIGIQANLQWEDSGLGLAQGSPLSPLLSNFYLADFDQLLQSTGLPWVRYADNILLLARDHDTVRAAWNKASAYLTSPCLLHFNSDSCRITTASDGFEFLGFWFKGTLRTMAPAKLEQKRAALTAALRKNQNDLPTLVANISETMLGWRNYYGAVDGVKPQLELLERHLEDLLIPWLQRYRSQTAATQTRSSAELKAILLELALPVLVDPRKKLKWVELLLSRSKPKPVASSSLSTVSPAVARAVQQRKKELAERRELLEEILVTKPGTYLGRTGERLLIRRDGKREAEVPFSLVRNITFLTTAISLSGEFIVETAARNIPILIAGPDGRPSVRIGPPELPGHELSLAQSALANSPAALDLARTIVAGKIRNQINLLQYYSKYPERRAGTKDFLADTTAAIRSMEAVAAQVSARTFSDDHELERNRLFAAEGQAALSYWSAVRSLLWWKPGFEKRTHRGATDLVNSLLNYGYGILYSRLWIVLIKAGLNVNVGFLHKPQPGKAGLLYDFIEEFRAAVVDRSVFSLLNLASDLETGEHGLTSDTRHLIARKILQRLQTNTRYHGENLPLQKITELQAHLLVRHIQSKERYKSFVLPW